jgi:hypothetical protein
MRMFELKYEACNTKDLGFVSQYMNPKTFEPTGLVRGEDGRIILTLHDKALSSSADLIETVSHELNHVRGYLKTGYMTAESIDERAAEMARQYLR